MNIYKKFAALALAGVMTLGLMAGCTTGGEETTPPTDTTTAPTAEGTDAATEPSSGETTEPRRRYADFRHYGDFPGRGLRYPGRVCRNHGRCGRR